MRRRFLNFRIVLIALAFSALGCKLINGPDRPLPLPEGVAPEQVIDGDNPTDSVTPLRPEELARVGKLIQAERQKRLADSKAAPPKKYNILALSGGAVYGAYSAGVLAGWSQSGLTPEQGGRPVFDVVTGISTGALMAPFAFLGSEYDEALRREYTSIRNEDLYTRQPIRRILSQSVVDNEPFRERIAKIVDADLLAKIAAEHDKGRRLYIGSTNLDTKRIVLWDFGAIAKRGTPDSIQLARDVIAASAAIPGFFPPVKMDVTIDGKAYQELHVDGAVSRSLFFRPPYVEPSQREAMGPDSLAGSNLYVIVAGKINPAPTPAKMRTLSLAFDATSMLTYSVTRGDLYRMYTYCLLTGMNLRVAAIPDDEKIPPKATEFVPAEMTELFEAGFKLGKIGDITRKVPLVNDDGEKLESEEERKGTAWRDVPPGLKDGEKQGVRTGRNLTVRPKAEGAKEASRGPEPPKTPILPASPEKN